MKRNFGLLFYCPQYDNVTKMSAIRHVIGNDFLCISKRGSTLRVLKFCQVNQSLQWQVTLKRFSTQHVANRIVENRSVSHYL